MTMRDLTETHTRELGKIENIDIVDNDHGGYALQIGFAFGSGGGHQSFAVTLSHADPDGLVVANPMAGETIIRIMLVFGASRLSAIRGRYAYAIRDKSGRRHDFIQGVQTLEPDGGRAFLIEDLA